MEALRGPTRGRERRFVTVLCGNVVARGEPLPWSEAGRWALALAAGGVAFGALGVAVGAVAREVQAASLLAFVVALPLAFLAIVPESSVSGALYDVISGISAAFPFKPALEALNRGLSGGEGIAGPLLHLAGLAAAYAALARLALRRFA